MQLKITQKLLRSFYTKSIALALLIVTMTTWTTAQTLLLNEGFATVPPAGWTITNNSTPVGTLSWVQGNTDNWTSFDGAPNAYAFVNYNSVAGDNTISNWLISPQITGIKNGDVVSFYTRTFEESEFPDRSQLRLSVSGASTNVGSTNTSVGDFSILLTEVNSSLTIGGYPEVWTKFTATVTGVTGVVNGRIALRYFVTSGGPAGDNSNGVGFDRVVYQSATVCNGTPAPGNTFSTSSVVCPGTAITLSAQNATSGDNVTYQWETSTSTTGPWAPVAGATSSTLTTSPTITAFYRVVVGCGALTTPTNPIQITITPCSCISPDLATICQGTIQRLAVTGAGIPGSVTASSGTIALSIPDDTPAGTSTTLPITLPVGASITSVTVNFNITHTWDGDVALNLVSPNGKTINLVNGAGGNGDNFVNTNISVVPLPSALPIITSGTAPFTGTYRFQGAAGVGATTYASNVTTLEAFKAPAVAAGLQTWRLALRDLAEGDVGTLTSWAITVNYEVLPTAVWTGGTIFSDAAATTPYVAGTEANAVWVMPSATTTYVANIASGPCSGANSVTVTVVDRPVVTVTPPLGGCAPLSLTASGGTNYSWTPAEGLSPTTGATVTANPAATTTYTVIGTNDAGCTSLPASVTVKAAPTAATITSISQPTYQVDEDFAVVTPTGPAGWSAQNLSNPVGLTGWFQGNTAVFPSFDGAPTAYIGANFNNTGANGTISNWLFTPTVNIKNGDVISFYTRAAPSVAGRAERLQVRMSTNGGSTNVGTTATSVGDFTTIVAEVNPNLLPGEPNYPETWTRYTATISGVTGTVSGRFAFRYFVLNGGNPGGNSNFIGIDRVQYGTPPTGVNCANVTTNIKVDITGGVGPYTLVYSNGTTNTTVNGYVSGSNIQVSPAVTTTYSIVSITGSNGCVGTGITGSVVITITPPPSITTAPVAKSVCLNGNTTFTVAAAPAAGNTFQWQVSTNGTTWTSLSNSGVYSGVTSTTLTITGATSELHNNRYRVVVTGSCAPAVTSAAVTLTVNSPAVITTQPTNKTICAGTGLTGTSGTFTVAATGGGLTYQWQVSTDGGITYTNVANGSNYAGATTNTLTVSNVSATFANYRYRAVVTSGGCTGVNSNDATLSVNPTPVLVLTANPLSALYPGQTTTLSVAVSPNAGATYTWFKDGVVVPGATGNTLTVNVDAIGSYTVNVADVNGCSVLSAATVITASENDRLFIYPSPSTGQFQVRYFSDFGALVVPRTVNVYDNKGTRVYSRSYSINSPYTRIDVNLSNHPKGIYTVELTDAKGDRIKTGRVVIL